MTWMLDKARGLEPEYQRSRNTLAQAQPLQV